MAESQSSTVARLPTSAGKSFTTKKWSKKQKRRVDNKNVVSIFPLMLARHERRMAIRAVYGAGT